MIGYGGSQWIESPNTGGATAPRACCAISAWTSDAFETAFDRTLYASLGLSTALFFARIFRARTHYYRAMGWSVPATTRRAGLRMPSRSLNSPPHCRLPGRARRNFSLFTIKPRSTLRTVVVRENPNSKVDQLSRLPDTNFRMQRRGRRLLSGPPAGILRDRLRSVRRPRCARDSAIRVSRTWIAGRCEPARREPYIYHFPDGNASFARFWFATLIPERRARRVRWTMWCSPHSIIAGSTHSIRMSGCG